MYRFCNCKTTQQCQHQKTQGSILGSTTENPGYAGLPPSATITQAMTDLSYPSLQQVIWPSSPAPHAFKNSKELTWPLAPWYKVCEHGESCWSFAFPLWGVPSSAELQHCKSMRKTFANSPNCAGPFRTFFLVQGPSLHRPTDSILMWAKGRFGRELD